MPFDKDQLTAAEKAILGRCGSFCPACDAYIGKAKDYAKEIFDSLGIDDKKIKKAAESLLEVMDQVNYDDVVGFFNLGVKAKEYEEFKKFLEVIAVGKVSLEEEFDIKAFQRVLRKFVKSPNCTGCGLGAGGATKMCPILVCCEEKGYLTCAECPDFQEHNTCVTVNENQIPSMITDNVTFFKLITSRYMNWNVENLKKIFRKGYKQYIKEMKEKCEKGFYSGQIICKDKVLRDLLGF